MLNSVVVNMGHGSWYARGSERLEHALKVFAPESYLLIYSNPKGQRKSKNYVHKRVMAQEAILKGIRFVFWMDSSVVPNFSIELLFEMLKTKGYFFLDNPGHNTGQWTSDKALNYFGVSRETLFNSPHISSCIFGFDRDNDLIKPMLTAFLNTPDEIFEGDWTNERKQVSKDSRVAGHRHDQTVLSILAIKHGLMDWEKLNDWVTIGRNNEGKMFNIYTA